MQTNPAVLSAAERFTDGLITDQVLRDVAAMERLSLYIDRAPVLSPDAAELARRELANAEASHREIARLYVAARAEIGRANTLGATPEARRHWRSQAFRMLNKRRAELLHAERRLGTARAALEPIPFLMAA
jgi:hypothetical protein